MNCDQKQEWMDICLFRPKELSSLLSSKYNELNSSFLRYQSLRQQQIDAKKEIEKLKSNNHLHKIESELYALEKQLNSINEEMKSSLKEKEKKILKHEKELIILTNEKSSLKQELQDLQVMTSSTSFGNSFIWIVVIIVLVYVFVQINLEINSSLTFYRNKMN